jgi:hypothetical protein
VAAYTLLGDPAEFHRKMFQMILNRISGKVGTAFPLNEIPAAPNFNEILQVVQRSEGFILQIG